MVLGMSYNFCKNSTEPLCSIALSKDENAVVFGGYFSVAIDTMYSYPNVGEDVAFGGVFRCTMGLSQEYGE